MTTSENVSASASLQSHNLPVPNQNQASAPRACSITRTRSTPYTPPRRSRSTAKCKALVHALLFPAHELAVALQYLDEVSKALTSVVRMVLSEVDQFRVNKRALQKYVARIPSYTVLLTPVTAR
jgi:hypothetical protein